MSNLIRDYNETEKSRLKKRLTAFFAKYDPEKLAGSTEDGGGIIQKTLSLPLSETVCIQKMCVKYEVDPKEELEDATRRGLLPSSSSSSPSAAAAPATSSSSTLIEVQNSIQQYSPSEKQRLANRLKAFFEKYVSPTASSETKNEVDKRIEKLLLGNVSEKELMKRVCAKYQVDPQQEETEAKTLLTNFKIKQLSFVNVSTYFGANRDRFYRRVLAFYKSFGEKKNNTNFEEKAAAVLEMEETEKKIVDKLISKYNQTEQSEKENAKMFQGYPEFDSCLTSAGGPVHLYNDFDKTRLRKRLEIFYQKNAQLPAEALKEKLDRVVTTMQEPEEKIFSKLCETYKVDRKVEAKEAFEKGVYPGVEEEEDFDEEDEEEEVEEEQEQEEIPSLSPISTYNPKCETRFRNRLKLFFNLVASPAELFKEQDFDEETNDENEIFAEILCPKYNIDPHHEQEEAKFHGLLPVCAYFYNRHELERLRKRFTIFYSKHNKDLIQKIESVVRMPESEETIFETLCTKYGEVCENEKQTAIAHGVFPQDFIDKMERKKNGTLHVCEYPFLEKEFRLKKRVALFYKKHVPEQTQEQNEKKIQGVLEMKNSEKEIFEKLCTKYNVPFETEKKEAENIFAFPFMF
jgi:hypothetical protein